MIFLSVGKVYDTNSRKTGKVKLFFYPLDSNIRWKKQFRRHSEPIRLAHLVCDRLCFISFGVEFQRAYEDRMVKFLHWEGRMDGQDLLKVANDN